MNAERVCIAVVMHVGVLVVSDTPFASLLQTVNLTSQTPGIEPILERFEDAISLFMLSTFGTAPVGKYDVVMAKCSVTVASSVTVGMKTAYHRIAASSQVVITLLTGSA